MRNVLATCLFILTFSNFAVGTLLYTSLDKSVKASDLIVIGTLQSVSKSETEEFEISKGILVIEKVVSGNVRTQNGEPLKAGDKIEVGWNNSKMMSCRFEIAAFSEGIWLLQLESGGTTKPLFPGAMVSVSELLNVEKELKKPKHSDKTAKTITIADHKRLKPETPINSDSAISSGIYSLERKFDNRPVLTLLIVLGSISLYYLLYRSRFKIR